MESTGYDILNTIFSGFGAIAAIIAAAAVFHAVRVLRFNAWVEAQRIFMNEDFIEARTKILSHFGFTGLIPSRIGQEDEEQALLVCRMMDELARLEPYLGAQKILDVWGIPLGKCWIILQFTVREEQDKGQPGKWSAFEQLGGKAIRKHNLNMLNKKMAKETAK